jgi:hypothetical protein
MAEFIGRNEVVIFAVRFVATAFIAGTGRDGEAQLRINVKQVFYNSGFAGAGWSREDNDLTLHGGLSGFLNDSFDGRDQTNRNFFTSYIHLQKAFQHFLVLVGFEAGRTFFQVIVKILLLIRICFVINNHFQNIDHFFAVCIRRFYFG